MLRVFVFFICLFIISAQASAKDVNLTALKPIVEGEGEEYKYWEAKNLIDGKTGWAEGQAGNISLIEKYKQPFYWGNTATFTWNTTVKIKKIRFLSNIAIDGMGVKGRPVLALAIVGPDDAQMLVKTVFRDENTEGKWKNVDDSVLEYVVDDLNIVSKAVKIVHGESTAWSRLDEVEIFGEVLATDEITEGLENLTKREIKITSELPQQKDFGAEKLLDGLYGWTNFQSGHNSLHEKYGGSFWWGNSAILQWDKKVNIKQIRLYSETEYEPQGIGTGKPPQCIAIYGKDLNGDYKNLVFRSEDTTADWKPSAKDNISTLIIDRLNVRADSIMIVHADPATWSRLAEIECYGTEMPDNSTQIAKGSDIKLQFWLEDPWTQTDSNKLQPVQADLDRKWELNMLRNDTEQAMIGIRNTGNGPVRFNVALEPDSSGKLTCELKVVGNIERRGTKNWWDGGKSTALMNLFNAEQVQSFAGVFPGTFGDIESYENFPELFLRPSEIVRLWVQISSFQGTNYAPAGKYKLNLKFTADGLDLTKSVAVNVSKVTLPAEPLLETLVYGSSNSEDEKSHHVTVSAGYKRYVFTNMLVLTNDWGKDLLKMSKEDYPGFQKLIANTVDNYYKHFSERGYSPDQIYVEVYDEPNDGSAQAWAAIAKEVKRYKPDAKIVANPPLEWDGHPSTVEGTFKVLAPYTDLWIPHIGCFPQEGRLDFVRSTGKPIWYYATPALSSSRVEEQVNGFYRTACWFSLIHNLSGAGWWSASTYYGDPWNDFDKSSITDWPDCAVVFPSSAGPISTRNWEAWRESVEDYAIFKMLEYAYNNNLLKPNDQILAKKWLEETPQKVFDDNLKTDGKTVKEAINAAVQILEQNWKPEFSQIKAAK